METGRNYNPKFFTALNLNEDIKNNNFDHKKLNRFIGTLKRLKISPEEFSRNERMVQSFPFLCDQIIKTI